MKAMISQIFKKIRSGLYDMTVAWKFTLAYFIIIALPIILIGIYISESTTQTVIHQSGLLMKQSLLQKREIINQKIESINRTSISIAYNPQILEYLEGGFENNIMGYEKYLSFAPLFENHTIQNKNVFNTLIHLKDKSFPDSWNGLYHLDKIEGLDWFNRMLEDEDILVQWSSLHETKHVKQRDFNVKEKVFSLYRKLISFKDKSLIGLLEIEISEKVLFEHLGKDNDTMEYYIVYDDQWNIVSENTSKDLPYQLQADIISGLDDSEPNGIYTVDKEQLAIYSIPLESINCRLVSITPLKYYMKDSPNYRVIVACLMVAVLIMFGLIINLVTRRLTKRLKLLVDGLRSVKLENINIKMPVDSHDEFGELAESFNHMTDRIHELIERVYKAQITEKEAELKALQAQINPHFLYNTLSTISWMARKVDAVEIDNLSLQLSQFYRLVLSKGNSIISVEDEINLLKAYVEIEKIRFDNLFQVVYDLDEEAFSYKTVKIILQPIAENTINHGIAPKECPGTMIIKLRQDEDNIIFSIIDDGVGMSRETLENICGGRIIKKRESGYAIHNIMERLKSVYGGRSRLSIFSRPGIGCAVEIVIPKNS
jgi:two-component system sensor histidine kinase YesM